ncbi:MAG: tRNA (adenosine(37)-N6)-threonylcarbamoyltransferase complex dimerization subunit type 1 TsaB [Defluviitaleaceae bacterium]|nr:tRNA (adenosine(37)-N6)-threonylcarbamoyltransferase complex dimerization subunit type 1 TsaB [Defluviitaleaceae bacterium]
MNILAIDTSGQSASCSLISAVGVNCSEKTESEKRIMAEFTINNKLTHSQTMLPMIDSMLAAADFPKTEIDFIAVSNGPGSFTGLRIGAAIAKGLAMALKTKLVPVSTLDALAYNVIAERAIIIPIMDARRNQVYSALYERENDELRRISDYLAEDINIIFEMANLKNHPVIFLGDAAELHIEAIKENPNFSISPVGHNLQRAALVGLLAAEKLIKNPDSAAVCAKDFELQYVRKSQAERVKESRQKQENI